MAALSCTFVDMDDSNMEFDSRAFYQQIEDEYNVTLRRNVRKSWEEYWAWLVYIVSIFHRQNSCLATSKLRVASIAQPLFTVFRFNSYSFVYTFLKF